MKRPLNEELVDVWAVLLSEKIQKLQELNQYEEDFDKYRQRAAKISGYTESMSLLSTLESGRFRSDYDRVINNREFQDAHECLKDEKK